MNRGEHFNPFPGPQPYREGDRHRFFGREDMTRGLLNRILAHPCVTFFGPSGAGKSSLMQASVIPLLQELHGFRVVRIDAWRASGQAPLEQLVGAMFADLGLGEVPTELSPREALDEAVRLAERYSARPILIYLDQLEQLLYPSRSPEGTDELFEGLGALARKPLRGLQLVLSLREDYLGRFR
ncbi:MAG TPA: AAA family ATPase, partial [Archangium sp.]|nr:AAA family ATPase [Archangium sp.]